MKKAIRWCADIGCFALDFPKTTCCYRTAYCNANCYNRKVYRMFKDKIVKRDAANYLSWLTSTPEDWKNALADKRTRQTDRFRFATRGETLMNSTDVDRVINVVQQLPETLFWIPTRAWRNPALRSEIVQRLFPLANIRLCASLDPSNSQDEIDSLKAEGWSTLYYGDDSATEGRIKCQKTWNHEKGACATCVVGCFSQDRTDVHLRKH